MRLWLHKVEHWVDKLIPFSLIVLFFLVVGEFFFYEELLPYHLLIDIIDLSIILLFILDLLFKYIRIRNVPLFLRTCWLEIIALLPVFFVVRIFEIFVR